MRCACGLEGRAAASATPAGRRNALPSCPTKKVGGPGTRLDMPLTHINASYVRSHFDAMEVAPRPTVPAPTRLVLALVMTTGARVHARVGGLKASETSRATGCVGLR
jgi:hypothetical protein